jgi:hypothetical protein
MDEKSSEQTEEERVVAFAERAVEFANEINKLAFVMGKGEGFHFGRVLRRHGAGHALLLRRHENPPHAGERVGGRAGADALVQRHQAAGASVKVAEYLAYVVAETIAKQQRSLHEAPPRLSGFTPYINKRSQVRKRRDARRAA